jgi:hypothetical protein
MHRYWCASLARRGYLCRWPFHQARDSLTTVCSASEKKGHSVVIQFPFMGVLGSRRTGNRITKESNVVGTNRMIRRVASSSRQFCNKRTDQGTCTRENDSQWKPLEARIERDRENDDVRDLLGVGLPVSTHVCVYDLLQTFYNGNVTLFWGMFLEKGTIEWLHIRWGSLLKDADSGLVEGSEYRHNISQQGPILCKKIKEYTNLQFFLLTFSPFPSQTIPSFKEEVDILDHSTVILPLVLAG